MLAVAFSCVSFEAECGFFGKGGGLSRLSARIEHEAQNFRDGTLKPVGCNLILEIEKVLRDIFWSVENNTQCIEDKITRGETQGIAQDIQAVNSKIDDIEIHKNGIIDKIENSEQNNSVATLSKTEIEDEFRVAEKKLELSKYTLKEAELERLLVFNKTQETGTELSESEKNTQDLRVVKAKISVQETELEVLYLQSRLKKAGTH